MREIKKLTYKQCIDLLDWFLTYKDDWVNPFISTYEQIKNKEYKQDIWDAMYRIAHGHNKNNKCFSVHKIWREEAYKIYHKLKKDKEIK